MQTDKDQEKNSFRRIRGYFELTRPFTLLAPIISVSAGIVMAALEHDSQGWISENWPKFILAIIAMGMAQMCGQIFNQSEDPVDLDIANNKGYRPLPKGLITPSEARIAGLGSAAIAMITAFFIGKAFFIGISILLAFAVFYSVEPIRAKRKKLLGIVWLGLSRGFLPLPIAWSILASPFEGTPMCVGTVLFFWVSGFQITKDIPDIEGDRKYGMPTFPVLYGISKTKTFMQIMNGVALGILILFIVSGKLMPTFFLTLPIFLTGAIVIAGIDEKKRKWKRFENSREWVFFYCGLSLIYIFSSVAVLIS